MKNPTSPIEGSVQRPAVEYLKQAGIRVEVPGGRSAVWDVIPGLSDRDGELEPRQIDALPLGAELLQQPAYVSRLREQMCGDLSFISYKDGEIGVLFETEIPVTGDEVFVGCNNLQDREVVEKALRLHMNVLSKDFPKVQFCLVPQELAPMERPGLWAWVKDGALSVREREALANRLTSEDEIATYTEVLKPTAAGHERVRWPVQLDLTDPWGGINTRERWRKPALALLESSPEVLESLLALRDPDSELTTIAKLGGEFGVLVDIEFETAESNFRGVGETDPDSDETVTARLLLEVAKLQADYPQVEFCVAPSDRTEFGRPSIWGWISARKHTPELAAGVLKRLQDYAYGQEFTDPLPEEDTSLPSYLVRKNLTLEVRVHASSAEAAEARVMEMDDQGFKVVESSYYCVDQHGSVLSEDSEDEQDRPRP